MKKFLLKYIDPAARFFLYLLIFWLPYSLAVVESSVITVLVLWLLKRALQFEKAPAHGPVKTVVRFLGLPETALNLPILFFITACLFSIAGSLMPWKSWHGFMTKTLEWFVVYFLILEFIQTRKHIKIIVALFVFSAAATCLDAVVQFYWTGKDFFLSRSIPKFSGATAAFHTYNILGGYLAFVLPVAFSLLLIAGTTKKYAGYALSTFLLVVWGLAVSLSRGAWAAAFLGLAFFLFFHNRKWLAILIGMVVLLTVGLVIKVPEKARAEFRTDADSFQGTVRWRLGVWEDSIKLIKQRPLTGYGLNTFMDIFQKHRRQGGGHVQYPPTYAHNCYVQVAFETGLLGLLSFLWIFVRLFQSVAIGFQKAAFWEDPFSVLLLGMLSAVFASLAHNFIDTGLYSLQLSVLLWYMTGLTVSVYKLLNTSGIRAIR